MPKGRPKKKRPLLRGFAAFFLVYGIAYILTLAYPDLFPAKLLLGAVNAFILAIVNGLVYGAMALLIVSVIYSRRFSLG